MAAPNNWRDVAADQAMQELARGASLSSERPAVATPFQKGDDALAASIKELKDKSLEYQRLATEESREQYENQVRANLQHENEVQKLSQDKAALSSAQDVARDVRQASILIRQMNAITASVPPGSTEHTMDPGKLKEFSNVMQELQKLQSAYYDPENPNQNSAQFDAMLRNEMEGTQVQQQAAPVQTPQTVQPEESAAPKTFDDGRFSHITDNGDGTYQVHMASGETFRGDALTVMELEAKSLAHTKAWARQQRQQAQPTNGNSSSAVTFGEDGSPHVDFSKIPDVTAWQMDQLATTLGYTDGKEMVADQIAQRQKTKEIEQRLHEREERDFILETSSTFLASAPDFPNTDEAIGALDKIIEANGWEWNLNSMLAANALAIRQGLYKPLDQDAQNAVMGIDVKSARPKAPPMLSSQSPDGNQRGFNPWDQKTVPLGDLRKMAILQELEGNGKRLGE